MFSTQVQLSLHWRIDAARASPRTGTRAKLLSLLPAGFRTLVERYLGE